MDVFVIERAAFAALHIADAGRLQDLRRFPKHFFQAPPRDADLIPLPLYASADQERLVRAEEVSSFRFQVSKVLPFESPEPCNAGDLAY